MDIALFKQRKALELLEQYSGSHTSLISLLIPPNTQLTRISKLLTQEISTAVNIKSRVNRQSVVDALKSIQQRMKLVSWLPKNGLAIYCGTLQTEESGKLKKVLTVLEPIRPIGVFTYRCDSHFLTEPLREMLASDDKYGFIIVDGNGCLMSLVQGNNQTELHRISVSLPKKHNKGGQSSVRFARLRLEARHNYLTKVAELAVKCFIDSDTSKLNVNGLVLAGSADFKDNLNDPKVLDPRIQTRIIGTFDIAYGFGQGLQQAIELSSEALKGVSIIQQKKLMQQFFNEISHDTGKYCFGVNDTMAALDSGAVEILLIWEKCDITRFILVDPATGAQTVLYAEGEDPPKEELKDKELLEAESLIDWLTDHYTEFGCRLEIVQDSTAEGSQFCKGFGGFGGIMRYKMEFPQEAVAEENGKQEESDDEQDDSDDLAEYF